MFVKKSVKRYSHFVEYLTTRPDFKGIKTGEGNLLRVELMMVEFNYQTRF